MAPKKSAARSTLAHREKPVKAQPLAKQPAKKQAPNGISATSRSPTPSKRKATEPAVGESRPSKKAASGILKPDNAAATKKDRKTLNTTPKQVLEVFSFGGNSGGELGLGDTATSASVRRPRLNPHLAPDAVGVVHIAVGGMHCLALTRDNKVLSWGVNDLGALGRDTTWDGGLVDMNDDDSDSGDDDGARLNPVEATPRPIDTSGIPADTRFTQLAASDNASFALTDDGHVYGWGTFRGNDGVIGFSPTVEHQRTPALIPALQNITKITTGENHVLALSAKGELYIWGAGEQAQLGRRIMERNRLQALLPWRIASLKHVSDIGAGSSHSFAITRDGVCYGWGQNNYGQTGISDDAGESGASTTAPTLITQLRAHAPISAIGGGNSHSFAITAAGKCLVWGRLDGCATGHVVADLNTADIISDERGRPRILKTPTALPLAESVVCLASGTEHCVAVTASGRAFAWGFSDSYRTGLGTDDDVPVPTLIDNTAVRGKKLLWAGAGGQFGVLAAGADV